MENLVIFIFGGLVGWTLRSFVSIPQGSVVPGSMSMLGGGGGGGPQKPLRGRIASCVEESSSPLGIPPKVGLASEPLHHWCYLLADGETAGDIAAAITGEEARYQELLLANPEVPKVGTPGHVGPEEWNFAPGSLAPGARLSIPQTWNPWIDQLGNPRGQRMAFPDDTRAPMVAATHGVPMITSGGAQVFHYNPPMQAVA
jgi:hypothetical protein